MWVLINHENDCFLFKEGYIRTSSTTYSINENDIDNKFIHLTNNAIQQNSKNYGEFEEGNQISFSDFQNYLSQLYQSESINFRNEIFPQMKNSIKDVLISVRNQINFNKRKFCYEIFGFDFIIDQDLNTWLIEVNTNPCLEESSLLLKKLIPRMIDDTFKLTIDLIYPPNQKDSKNSSIKVFPFEGYSDNENMW